MATYFKPVWVDEFQIVTAATRDDVIALFERQQQLPIENDLCTPWLAASEPTEDRGGVWQAILRRQRYEDDKPTLCLKASTHSAPVSG